MSLDLLDRVLRAGRSVRESLENPSFSLSNPPSWFWDWAGASRTKAGARVGPRSALGLSAFWACVKILSETVGSLSLQVYRQLNANGDKELATDRPEYWMLHNEPNPQMTSMVMREVGQSHLLTWGNSYWLIQFTRASKVRYLWPLLPEKTVPVRTNGNLVYETTDTPDGKRKEYAPEEIVHVPGLSFNGLVGFSPVAIHRETIGHGLATESYGAELFGSGGKPGGVLEVPETLTDEAYGRLKNSFKEQIERPHSTVILEGGTKYHVITLPPEDAQYIETRKFTVADMARIHRIPLSMLEEHDKAAAYASVEQFFLMFAVHTVRPWLVRLEQELNRKVFGVGSELSCEHSLDSLLRGDLKSRYDAYHQAISDGWFTWNDVCRKENLNLVPASEGGDTHWVNSNMVPSGRALKPPTTPQPAATPPPDASLTRHGSNGAIANGGNAHES